MTARDPRNRLQRYDGARGREEFVGWIIGAVRVLAVPTALLSLLLVVDVFLAGTVEQAIAYRRAVDTRWLAQDGYSVSVAWPNRAGCLDRTNDRRLLYTTRPGCSGEVGVTTSLGRHLNGSDTLEIVRTPLFGQVREVRHPAEGQRDRGYPLLQIALYVGLGVLPLLSFGSRFAVHPTEDRSTRRYLAYVLPSLFAEAVYVYLVIQAIAG